MYSILRPRRLAQPAEGRGRRLSGMGMEKLGCYWARQVWRLARRSQFFRDGHWTGRGKAGPTEAAKPSNPGAGKSFAHDQISRFLPSTFKANGLTLRVETQISGPSPSSATAGTGSRGVLAWPRNRIDQSFSCRPRFRKQGPATVGSAPTKKHAQCYGQLLTQFFRDGAQLCA